MIFCFLIGTIALYALPASVLFKVRAECEVLVVDGLGGVDNGGDTAVPTRINERRYQDGIQKIVACLCCRCRCGE